jgi:hypothetical protein
MKLCISEATTLPGTVSAEDALIAELKVKHEKPDAAINYVRRSNRRGDRRHPHRSVGADA